MIQSLFIINKSGDILLEKHWRAILPRAICDYFFKAQLKAVTPDDIPPVIIAPHHYLINIFREKLHYVAVTTGEVPPLYVLEFLHRVVDVLRDYFTEASETTIKANYVLVFEILDEMLDNGYPLVTESNILKELLRPPDLLRDISDKVTGTSTGVSAVLPQGQLSNVPWRRSGVKYTNNEAYFDVIEQLDAIIDKSGSVVMAEIEGRIDCLVKLSGMPDLTLNFVNSRLLEDPSFHPCIRFRRWEAEKILSFVPPDGNFRLISYNIANNNHVGIPLALRHRISFYEGGGRVELTLSANQNMGKTLEDVELSIEFASNVTSANLTPSVGKTYWESTTSTLAWTVGKVEAGHPPTLKGTVVLASGTPVPDSNPTIYTKFSLPQVALSGVRLNRVDMSAETYKMFKGVKYISKAGKFQFRT